MILCIYVCSFEKNTKLFILIHMYQVMETACIILYVCFINLFIYFICQRYRQSIYHTSNL